MALRESARKAVSDLVEEGVEVSGDVQAGLAGAEVAAVPEPAAAEVPP